MAEGERLAAAAHYVIARFPPSHLGAVKLQKVLWFADCAHYARHGRSITGVDAYVRKQNGPCVPNLDAVLKRLEQDGRIAEKSVETYIGYNRREFCSLKEPDTSSFTGEEIDLLVTVGQEISRLTAQEASDLSHDSLWTETRPNSHIKVAAGAVRVAPPTPADMDWARAAFQ